MTRTRTALVTGGGTGIGLATARQLVSDGTEVLIVGRRREVLEAAVAELGPSARYHVADLTLPAQVATLTEALPETLDVVVHNAGGTVPGNNDGLEGTAAHWDETYRLNVLSAVLTQEVVEPRLSRPGGRVVAVSSIAALRGNGAYGAAKGAINSWITDLAARLAPDQITVNAVAPGFVPDTEFWEGRRTPDVVEPRIAAIPSGTAGTPAQIAALICHLASPEAGFTTGQVVGIHGGALLARS